MLCDLNSFIFHQIQLGGWGGGVGVQGEWLWLWLECLKWTTLFNYFIFPLSGRGWNGCVGAGDRRKSNLFYQVSGLHIESRKTYSIT